MQWTDEMIATLRALRAKRVPPFVCAERIGVSYPVIVLKARELGLAQRFNKGRTPGLQSAPT
jgi:hypothetical protein